MMNDDVDIYGDLPSFDVNECVRCKEKSNELTEKSAKFEEESSSWKSKFETYETEKKTILLNTSSLLKTARAEIARKDKIILELRRQLEDLKFKRGIWSRAKTNYSESRSQKKRTEKNFNGEESSIEAIKPSPVFDRSSLQNISDEDVDDAEQKFQPDKQRSTLYGERLRRKILSEQEAERIQKEKAKLSASDEPSPSLLPDDSKKQTKGRGNNEELSKIKNSSTNDKPAQKKTSDGKDHIEEKWNVQNYSTYEEKLKNTKALKQKIKKMPKEEEEYLSPYGSSVIKTEEEINDVNKPTEMIMFDVKSDYRNDESLPDRNDEERHWKHNNVKSNSGFEHFSEGDHKNHRFTDRRYDESLNSREERYKDDFYHYQNSNFNQDWRYNSLCESSYDHRSRQPRDEFFHFDHDRRSQKHQETQHKRQFREKRSKSNYQGRSKTPERGYNDNKKNFRHRRSDKYKDHNEKYEKRRDDGLPRDRYNFTEYYNKDDYDNRERLEHKYNDKFIDRNDYDNHKNYDSDNKRGGKSRSPTDKFRYRSNGTSIEQNDKRDSKRSRSRGSCRNIVNKTEMEKNLEDRKDLRVRKIFDDQRQNCDRVNLQENHFESSKRNFADVGDDKLDTCEDNLRVKSMDLHAEVKTLSVDEKREETMDRAEVKTSGIDEVREESIDSHAEVKTSSVDEIREVSIDLHAELKTSSVDEIREKPMDLYAEVKTSSVDEIREELMDLHAEVKTSSVDEIREKSMDSHAEVKTSSVDEIREKSMDLYAEVKTSSVDEIREKSMDSHAEVKTSSVDEIREKSMDSHAEVKTSSVDEIREESMDLHAEVKTLRVDEIREKSMDLYAEVKTSSVDVIQEKPMDLHAEVKTLRVDEIQEKPMDLHAEVKTLTVDEIREESMDLHAEVKTLRVDEIREESMNLHAEVKTLRVDEIRVESMSLHAEVKTSTVDEIREESLENTAAAMETLTNLVNQVETQDKFILMLENDGEIPLSPLTKPEMESIGSRSFREEKIENIEKFIQDYQCDVMNCAALVNDENPEHNEENEFANSTSSIVDTLSMDIDDLVVDDNLEHGTIVQPENTLKINVGNISVDKKMVENVTNQELGVKIDNENFQNVEIDNIKEDEETRDGDIDKEDVIRYKKSEDVAIHEKLKKPVIHKYNEEPSIVKKIEEEKAIDEELTDADADKKFGELIIDEKLPDEEFNVKSADAVNHKFADTLSDRNLSSDKKSEIIAIGKESNDSTIHKASKEISNEKPWKDDKKSKDAAVDMLKKSEDISPKTAVTVDRKFEDSCREIGSTVSKKINHPFEEDSLDHDSKSSAVGTKSIVIDNKLDCIEIHNNIEDFELQINSKNDFIDGISSDTENDNKSTNNSLVKKSEDTKIREKTEKIISIISPPLPPSILLPPLPPLPPSILLPPLPPLPPSILLPPLPPLPPSPPPEEKDPEISKVDKISTINSDKRRTDKCLSKQTKNRPRIPCLPIVSLYSRKRRNFVLADSASSHTIVKSLKEFTTTESENEKMKPSKFSETEKKIVSNSARKLDSPKSMEIQTNNFACGTIISANRSKPDTVNLPKVSDITDSKNVAPIVSESGNTMSKSAERKLNSSSSCPISEDRKKIKDDPPVSSLLSKKKNIVKNDAKIIDKNVEETRSKTDAKKIAQTKHSDGINKNKNSISSKSSERGKRTVLRTIVTKVSDGDATSSNRKRPLSKEKENQSKPAKQAKIMIVARRRPIQLEDSSTATTLVSSEHEESIKDSSLKNPVKTDVPRRRGRRTDS